MVVGPCRLFCALGNWAEQYKTGFSEWILYRMGFVTYWLLGTWRQKRSLFWRLQTFSSIKSSSLCKIIMCHVMTVSNVWRDHCSQPCSWVARLWALAEQLSANPLLTSGWGRATVKDSTTLGGRNLCKFISLMPDIYFLHQNQKINKIPPKQELGVEDLAQW